MNYQKLSTPQLEALLETASEGDLQTIRAIIKERQEPTESTPEPVEYGGMTGRTRICTKLDGVQLRNKADDLRKKYEGQPCQVIPYNSDQWVDGIVLGVLVDILHRDIKYSIKTCEGKRLTKSFLDSSLKVEERKKDIKYEEPKPKKRKETARDRAMRNWDPEAEIEKAIHAVGCLVLYEVRKNEDTGEETNIFGRVISLCTHNNDCCVMLRIKIPVEGGRALIKHKVFREDTTPLIDDEQTAKIRQEFIDRRNRRKRKDCLNPTQRVRLCEDNYKKAQESLERAKDMLELRRRQLEDALDDLRNSALTK